MPFQIFRLILPLLGLIPLGSAHAQKVLQIERLGSARTQKLSIGTALTYQLHGDPVWYSGEIVNLLPEDSIVLFNNRYIKVDKIRAFRWDLGWPRSVGRQLFWFGAGWSGFALIGTATDGNPDTQYEWSDAAVTGTSLATSWLLPRIFKYRKIRFGKNRRLRALDLDPAATQP